ncbi:hypothetical protein FQZ97_899580 [compost metagenome]
MPRAESTVSDAVTTAALAVLKPTSTVARTLPARLAAASLICFCSLPRPDSTVSLAVITALVEVLSPASVAARTSVKKSRQLLSPRQYCAVVPVAMVGSRAASSPSNSPAVRLWNA